MDKEMEHFNKQSIIVFSFAKIMQKIPENNDICNKRANVCDSSYIQIVGACIYTKCGKNNSHLTIWLTHPNAANNGTIHVKLDGSVALF